MSKNRWVWISIEKKSPGFLSAFCNFLTANNLDKDDYIELPELENKTHKFYVFKADKAELQ